MHYCVAIEDVKELVNHNNNEADLSWDGIPLHIELAKQKTGYGEKLFMKCPICGSRRTELFLYENKLICRICYPKNIYAGIQNHTVGGYKYIAYRMRQYANKNNTLIKRFPFRYYEYEKPVYKNAEMWLENISVLQAL